MRSSERQVDQAALDAGTDVLEHRGPDGRGTHVDRNVGLGNRRLAIIDKPGGQQPMSTADGRLWITFNGEIYNYLDLRSELLQSGYPLRTHSDTEVLLGLYDTYGVEMFSHLNGMFAFAIWDSSARRLLLARDRFGEKPLYWYRDDQQLVFGSEIKAILTVPGVRREADEVGLQEYLTFQHCLGERTLFSGVHRMPPASFAIFDEVGAPLRQETYWTLAFEEDHQRSEKLYIDELQFLLEDAVKMRLRSDVPVGTYLSGGLDSSIVTALAARLSGKGLPAFTGYFGESPAFNELDYAAAVAASSGSEHHTVRPEAEDFAADLQRIIYHLDEPAAGPGAFAQLAVSRLASDQVKVVLGGQGGDEIFGGYARYLIMYLEESIKGSIFESQDPSKHLVTLAGALPNLSLLQQYVPLLQRFWSNGLFDPIERRYFSLVNRGQAMGEYLHPGFLAARDDAEIYASFEREFGHLERHVSTGSSSMFNRMTAYDMRTSLQSLLQVEDRMSMAVSLESRLPLLDHRIAELMFMMPPIYKYRDGKSKSALQAAAGSFIPAKVLSRKDKMGFPVPFVEWAQGGLRGFVSDILLSDKAMQRGLYRKDGLERLIQGETTYGRELWGLLCLETWFDTFID
jgi:asparagine synthase (glutamine-hydrolysing)